MKPHLTGILPLALFQLTVSALGASETAASSDFLSAGDDIGKAMTSLGYGQNEIDEVVCILVSLKDQVVLQ